MSPQLKYVFCGDDFTGASDTLATLTRAGLRCRLFLSASAVRECPELSQLDVVGIATATRSMKPDEILEELTSVGEALAVFGAHIFHYKVCSTFDSSPDTGSIGAAVLALKKIQPDAGVMIVGGQPSLRRYCVFSNLFAAAVDGDVYRLDTHPTMVNHPATPMSEADLRKLLAAQGLQQVHGIHLHTYSQNVETLRQEVCSLMAESKAVLFDAHDQSDLSLIGELMHALYQSRKLIVGASSVAEAYISGLPQSDAVLSPHTPTMPAKPTFIFAGSRSQATAAQVENATDFYKILIHPADIEAERSLTLLRLTAYCLEMLEQGKHVLACVTNDMGHSLSRTAIAEFSAEFIARTVLSGLVGRLGIAGGDTSSFALQALGVDSLSYQADIEPGICLCKLHSHTHPIMDGLETALKGGQMGSKSLFSKLTGLL
jgi:uncharacterized protein YgbK (DUF1537 family)